MLLKSEKVLQSALVPCSANILIPKKWLSIPGELGRKMLNLVSSQAVGKSLYNLQNRRKPR